jgi:hypothetical protein
MDVKESVVGRHEFKLGSRYINEVTVQGFWCKISRSELSGPYFSSCSKTSIYVSTRSSAVNPVRICVRLIVQLGLL